MNGKKRRGEVWLWIMPAALLLLCALTMGPSGKSAHPVRRAGWPSPRWVLYDIGIRVGAVKHSTALSAGSKCTDCHR